VDWVGCPIPAPYSQEAIAGFALSGKQRIENPLMGVFQSRILTRTWESGEFDCPVCGAPQMFMHRSQRRFLTIGSVPFLPLEHVREFIECQQCGHEFESGILEEDAEARRKRERLEFARHVVWVVLLAAKGLGELTTETIQTIQEVFHNLSGVVIDAEEIRREGDQVAQSEVTAAAYIQRFIEAFQAPGRKDLTLQAVTRVLVPSGRIDPTLEAVLAGITVALETPIETTDPLDTPLPL
jgi:hypothetical protein